MMDAVTWTLVSTAALLVAYGVWRVARLRPLPRPAAGLEPVEVDFWCTYDRHRRRLVVDHAGTVPVRDVRVWWAPELGRGEPEHTPGLVAADLAPGELLEAVYDAESAGLVWHDEPDLDEDEDVWAGRYLELRVELRAVRADGRPERGTWDRVYAAG